VVWQKGVELRRSCVPERANSGFYADTLEALSRQYVQVRLAEGWRPTRAELKWDTIAVLPVDGETLEVVLDRRFGERNPHYPYGMLFDDQKIRANVPSMDSDEAYHVLRDRVASWHQFQRRWAKQYQARLMLDSRVIDVRMV
jgi:hypothetical protein